MPLMKPSVCLQCAHAGSGRQQVLLCPSLVVDLELNISSIGIGQELAMGFVSHSMVYFIRTSRVNCKCDFDKKKTKRLNLYHAYYVLFCRERNFLEKQKQQGIDEILLVDGDGFALEGLITNFFVVMDGRVMTAGDGVLHGQMRELVMRCCTELQIPILMQAPDMKLASRWQEAFATSECVDHTQTHTHTLTRLQHTLVIHI